MESENGDETSAVAGVISLASVSEQRYVSELLSFTLDRLHKEPELLRVDAEGIERQMQEVPVGNYGAFIAAADALLAIRHQITEIPNLTSGCTDFVESAREVLEKRKMNQALLANHTTLLDLLEIPQLMHTCVRNGNYDEALVWKHMFPNYRPCTQSCLLFKHFLQRIGRPPQSLLSQLLQKLRSNIQLPECLWIIGYLCQIGVFSEYEMHLQEVKKIMMVGFLLVGLCTRLPHILRLLKSCCQR